MELLQFFVGHTKHFTFVHFFVFESLWNAFPVDKESTVPVVPHLSSSKSICRCDELQQSIYRMYPRIMSNTRSWVAPFEFAGMSNFPVYSLKRKQQPVTASHNVQAFVPYFYGLLGLQIQKKRFPCHGTIHSSKDKWGENTPQSMLNVLVEQSEFGKWIMAHLSSSHLFVVVSQMEKAHKQRKLVSGHH